MNWLGVALWGGLVGVDATSLFQTMISRPLVAAPLTGLILGRPLEGMIIGLVLEAFALVILPIGAARHPEAGTAAVAATAAYISAAPAGVEAQLLLMAVVFGLLWESVAGVSVTVSRRINERIVAFPLDRSRRPDRRLTRRQLAALGLDFLRALVVVAAGAGLGGMLLRGFGHLWAFGATAAVGVLALAGTLMLGAVLPLFGGWNGRRIAFTVGLLCGSALLWIR